MAPSVQQAYLAHLERIAAEDKRLRLPPVPRTPLRLEVTLCEELAFLSEAPSLFVQPKTSAEEAVAEASRELGLQALELYLRRVGSVEETPVQPHCALSPS
ncbi:MAG: hypothetical protein EBY28_27985, partial [Betaproteobacteria bacterium]|nr:hypothetical protein [Betaproteobacteria bacterium]